MIAIDPESVREEHALRGDPLALRIAWRLPHKKSSIALPIYLISGPSDNLVGPFLLPITMLSMVATRPVQPDALDTEHPVG